MHPSRRAVLVAACGTCAAALTGCAVYGRPTPAPVPAPVEPAPNPAPVEPPPPGAAPPADALVTTAAVPVGGGTVLAERDLVITQPVAGEFRAFSATCTHQGCAVGGVADGEIVCPCHGSVFSARDGAVLAGPATTGLAERNITVRDGAVVLV